MAKKNKSKSNNSVRSFVFVVVLAVIVVGALTYLIMNEQGVSKNEKTVATVNGEKITESELEAEYATLPAEYSALISKEDVLGQIIDRKLLFQEADKQGISVSQQEIDSQIATIMQQFPTEDAFYEILDQQNLTLDEIKFQLEQQLKINKLLNQSVLSKIGVIDEEIESYYTENKDQFKASQGEIRAAHILVSTKEDAEDVLDKLNDGADFGELAAEMSIDPSAAVNKGHLGFFSEGTMVKEFEDAAFKLKVGEVSQPVQTQFGFHIIKRLPNVMTLEESKDQIATTLKNSKQSKAIQDYLDGLRAKADIEYTTNISEETSDTGKTLDIDEGQETGAAEETETTLLKVENEFESTGDGLCTIDGKPVIRFYTSSNCQKCETAKQAFLDSVKDFDVFVYIWELDTGDDLFTQEKETSIPNGEFEVLKQYNPKFAVPSYIFGCEYVRIGNAYANPNAAGEEEVFKGILKELI